MIFLKKTNNYKKSGETLIEVLVAMIVFSFFIISVFNLVSQAISTNTNIKVQIMALNLAREGIEGVRNIRDTNWLKYSGDMRNQWANGLSSGDYRLIYNNNIYSLDSDTDYKLYQQGSPSAKYTHTSTNNTPTPFSRKIKTTLSVDELTVLSTVFWEDEKGIQKEVKLETILYDYYQRTN